MNLPQDTTAAARNAVQALWGDTADITRNAKVGNVMQEVPVYTAVKCHLSQASPPVLSETSTAATTTTVFTLFVDPSIIIQEGDSLTIRHKQQVFSGKAGRPFYRNISAEIKVEVNKIA